MGTSMTRPEALKYLKGFSDDLDFIAGELDRLLYCHDFSTNEKVRIEEAIRHVDSANNHLCGVVEK